MKNIVLITGASSGIGRETALKYAKNEHPVIIICKNNRSALMDLEREILEMGGRVLSYVKDVSQFNEVSEMFRELETQNMIPDILINNAGISYVGLLQDMSPEEWRSVIDTNLTSAFNCSKCAIPYMLKKHSGRIVNISSMWGNVGASCEVAYSASKGGINTFTKALAKELAPSGIAVNAIAFGMVDTRMNAFLDEEEKASLIEEIPAGRILSPQESADIIYSVSMMNSYVTGQIITADGGMT
jgi:3-oxoacyl-[acyl-carrier protein] reductase